MEQKTNNKYFSSPLTPILTTANIILAENSDMHMFI